MKFPFHIWTILRRYIYLIQRDVFLSVSGTESVTQKHWKQPCSARLGMFGLPTSSDRPQEVLRALLEACGDLCTCAVLSPDPSVGVEAPQLPDTAQAWAGATTLCWKTLENKSCVSGNNMKHVCVFVSKYRKLVADELILHKTWTTNGIVMILVSLQSHQLFKFVKKSSLLPQCSYILTHFGICNKSGSRLCDETVKSVLL